jgi:Rrf2 family transcriptional regulator, cysteine metabolism repressor
MRISSRGRYGTRAMLALAMHYDKGLLSAHQIAIRHNISRRYLDSLLKVLKNARLVNSERGRRGGYILSLPPTEINLHDVLSALEDGFDIVHCTKNGLACGRSGSCCTQEVWCRIRHTVESILWQTSLADLVVRQVELDNKRGYCVTKSRGADCDSDNGVGPEPGSST